MKFDEIQKILLEFFSAKDEVHLVVLFGSYAKGTAMTSSDMDVAVYGASPLGADEKAGLIDALQQRLRLPVDLVDLHTADPLIFRQIFTKGVILLNRSATAYEKILRRLVYDEADFLPLVRRTLRERANRFANGQ